LSEKNGEIIVEKFLWQTRIIVGHTEQSGPYVRDMWRKAIRRISKKHPIKQVLLVGLGGGNAVLEIQKRFKKAHITVIEWDQVMVEIAKKFQMLSHSQPTEIIIGDAALIIPDLSRRFDLIILDAFTGNNPEKKLVEENILISLRNLLEIDGYLMVNVFRHAELLYSFKKVFSFYNKWRYKANTLGLFRHFGRGRAGDPLPDWFIHKMHSHNYALSAIEEENTDSVIGREGCLGLRSRIGSVSLDSYFSDTEPEIEKSKGIRMVVWHPITRIDKATGWHRFFLDVSPQADAFLDLQNKKEYWKDWTERAERYRKKWLKNDIYEIEEISLEKFISTYQKTEKISNRLKKMFVRILNRNVESMGKSVHLFGVLNKETKEIVAGLAVCDFPDISQSFHLVSFINTGAEKSHVGVGLIDHWIKGCLERKIRFPNFGTIWLPGNSKSWIGFTKFKQQFNPFVLRYPQPLFKFIWIK